MTRPDPTHGAGRVIAPESRDMRDPANHALPSRPNTGAPRATRPRPQYAQRSLIIGLILSFVLIFWTVQLFILMTSLDAYLGHEHGLLWPAALSSLLLAALTLVLVRLIPKDPRRD